MRITIDTNVLIAAFVSHGVCAELLEHCVRLHKLITSKFILDEFMRSLVAKFKIPRREAAEATKLLQSHMTVVVPYVLGKKACRDPEDDAVLGTAVAGRCKCIITGDKDLLVLKKHGNVDILSPHDFWKYEDETGI
jgi:putative PIN family toxin of toxin-antitoxin system